MHKVMPALLSREMLPSSAINNRGQRMPVSPKTILNVPTNCVEKFPLRVVNVGVCSEAMSPFNSKAKTHDLRNWPYRCLPAVAKLRHTRRSRSESQLYLQDT